MASQNENTDETAENRDANDPTCAEPGCERRAPLTIHYNQDDTWSGAGYCWQHTPADR